MIYSTDLYLRFLHFYYLLFSNFPTSIITRITYHISYITYHITHIIYHISYIIYHISHITYHISYITYHISYVIYHISYITYHIFKSFLLIESYILDSVAIVIKSVLHSIECIIKLFKDWVQIGSWISVTFSILPHIAILEDVTLHSYAILRYVALRFLMPGA